MDAGTGRYLWDFLCIRPVADPVSEGAVGLMEKPLGMLPRQNGIRRGVVIYDVDYKAHTALMYLARKLAEIVDCAEFRINGAVIADSIGRAEAALSLSLADGMDRHKPYDIRAERLYPVKLGNDRLEGTLL